jgi:hypothetical protein
MRPPQHGQGCEGVGVSLGLTAFASALWSCGTPMSSRARAMLSASFSVHRRNFVAAPFARAKGVGRSLGHLHLPTMMSLRLYGARFAEARSPKDSADGGILSAREVVNLLRQARYDRTRRIPIACLARAAGMSRETLYAGMNSDKVSAQTCVALTLILREIAAGRLGFQRRARRWEQIEYPQPSHSTGMPPPVSF